MLKNKITFISNYLNKLLTSYYKLKKQKPWQKKQKKPLRKKPLKKGTEKPLRKSLLKGSTKKRDPAQRGFFLTCFFFLRNKSLCLLTTINIFAGTNHTTQ